MSTENQNSANENAAVTVRRNLTPEQRLKGALESRVEELGRALAGRVDPNAYLRAAYTAIAKQPQLLECTTASLMMAVLESASLGLTIGGPMGEAYLVSYNTKVKLPNGREEWQKQAQLQPGYRGLVKLSRQSGMIRTVVPRAVYQGEEFEVEYGVNETIRHRPNLDVEPDQQKLTHVYAVAHFADGTVQFEVMTRKQVEEIKSRSKSKDRNGNVFGPWITDFTEMALKTVVRRLCKRLPLSDFDLARAIELDNQEFDGVEAPARSGSTTDLNARLAQAARARQAAGPEQAPEPEEAEYEVLGDIEDDVQELNRRVA